MKLSIDITGRNRHTDVDTTITVEEVTPGVREVMFIQNDFVVLTLHLNDREISILDDMLRA